MGGSETARSPRPRADQFCVYNANTKLPLGHIYEGLENMELKNVVQCRETEAPPDRTRALGVIRRRQ